MIEVEVAEYGLRMFSIRNLGKRTLLRITTLILPNALAVPGSTGGDGYSISWQVPIDDTKAWRYAVHFRRSGPMDKEVRLKMLAAEVKKDHHLVRNKENRYLQDREQMKTTTFSGLGPFIPIHDITTVGLQGVVQDRTQEHLGYSDMSVTAVRRLFLRLLRDEKALSEPFPVLLPVVMSETIPASDDWRTYAKGRIREEESTALKTMGTMG